LRKITSKSHGPVSETKAPPLSAAAGKGGADG
jgi:hypothetical protein